jgi:hypothetical protein
MRTAIWSRARAVFFTVAIIVVAIMLVVLRAWPTQEYSYQPNTLEVPPLASGQSLTLQQWAPSRVQTSPGAVLRSVICASSGSSDPAPREPPRKST